MPAFASQIAAPAPLARWWATKTRAERRIALALAIAVAGALAWILAWRPIVQDTAALRAAAPTERLEFAQAQKMVAEIAGLARTAPVTPAADPRAEVERAFAARGVGGIAVDWRDGRARVTLDAVRFDALVAALDTLARDAGLRVVEATLTARIEPGTVRAEMTLAR